MADFFFTILYQPLYNVLVGLYDVAPWGGLGLAIILMTVLIKVVLLPLTYKSLKAQKEMQEIQPRIAEIKKEFKDDKERLAKELMNVYKHHKVNPFASCLPTIVQLVVFIALYQVLRDGIQQINPDLLYAFIPNPGAVNHIFLAMDLTKVSVVFAVLAAAAQYFQAKQMISQRPPKEVRGTSGAMDEDVQASMNKMMVTVLPIVMLVIGVTTLSGGLTLYIFVSTLVTLAFQMIFLRKPKVAETPAVIDVIAK